MAPHRSPGPPGFPAGNAALVIGHPGHELRAYRWLELARPVVFVITDGSGHGTTGRVPSTDRILNAVGATTGSLYGRLSDREVYEHLVSRNTAVWVDLAMELAESLRRSAIDYVVADAAEGFNPTHDLCRYVTDAATARVALETGREVPCIEFDLDAAPSADRDEASPVTRLVLDEASLDRKIAAALGYTEIRNDVERLLARFGRQAFAVETYRRARSGATRWADGRLAEYERFGRERISSGFYRTLISYDEHLAPVQAALAGVAHASVS